MLKQRIITAVILAVVFVGSIIFGSPAWVSILFAIMLGVATHEMSALTLKPASLIAIAIGGVFAVSFWWFETGLSIETLFLSFRF